jgi:small subunit ribosomal protein S4
MKRQRMKRMRRVGTTLDYFRTEPDSDKIAKPPGQHGASRRSKPSVYGTQLKCKQEIRYYYNLREKQFRLTYERAVRLTGSSSLNLLRLLESRLDNLVYRMGFGGTRAHARQLVNHRKIFVNGNMVSIASYQVALGDEITIKESERNNPHVKESLEDAKKRSEDNSDSEWLDIATDKSFKGVYKSQPELEHLPQTFNPNQVVELYSK